MARGTKKSKRIVLSLLGAFLALLLIAEIGTYFGLPNWRELIDGPANLGHSSLPEGHLDVHFIDVGNADCILVRQDDAAMLIDAGERGDAEEIVSYLRKEKVEKLQLVIATHPHADHIGSMADVIETFEIDNFLMTFMPEEETPTTKVYLDMLEALDAKDVPVTEVLPGDSFALGEAKVEILAPIDEDDDPNAMSVVSRVSFGETAFLFMGDAEKAVEKDILASGRSVKADVLKVGHHGSNTGSTEAFLEAVSPEYAVLTCGAGNSYGHPHEEVLLRLSQHKVSVYRSDVNGTVRFISDGRIVVPSVEKRVG